MKTTQDGPRRRPGRTLALVLAVLAGVPLLAAGGVFLYLMGKRAQAPDPDNALRVEAGRDTAPAEEARINVLALCDAVQMYRAEHGAFLSAGPTPLEVPRGGQAVSFPHDEAFEKLGFAPGTAVRFQYQVAIQENPVGEAEVTCYARGDLDGDGQNAVYRVMLDANGMTSPVEVEREGE
ncbi:hypothetical protein POL68_31125 [Stigmatella sp. ncwal1]|uniref:Uncharacterized protein n=1 Tax=Stigmatella ashevillensis TaxID=2995309 RepID=A0ABT5DIH5_9BACT|nr:hypothetical protein [Stigmatella ashevillena]MDC0712955.1 hypothetical protein [Stigmatella ashevillena]